MEAVEVVEVAEFGFERLLAGGSQLVAAAEDDAEDADDDEVGAGRFAAGALTMGSYVRR